MTSRDTVDETGTVRGRGPEPKPGVLVLYAADAPVLIPIPQTNVPVLLGRDNLELPADERLSRRHVEISLEGKQWIVRDLGSRNGTFVDGERVSGVLTGNPRVVRAGRTLAICVRDLRRFVSQGIVMVDPAPGNGAATFVTGPTLRQALERIEQVAMAGGNVLISGETGVGKEFATRVFHARGPNRAGPLVAINCATIPEGVAERLLFGAKRGAYSGANTDVSGYLQAADHGVLFLDEFGELELGVQAKLLRTLESAEVMPLGATVSRPIDVRYCFATNRDLRAAVSEGVFRADLFFRVGQPEARIPPLRERPEEIPTLLARELGQVSKRLVAHVTLVETCLVRPWPGNVRELLRHVKRAGEEALAAGEHVVRAQHLDPDAGSWIDKSSDISPVRQAPNDNATDPELAAARRTVTREEIETALRLHDGNVAATARALTLHRTQLYRWMRKLGITEPLAPE